MHIADFAEHFGKRRTLKGDKLWIGRAQVEDQFGPNIGQNRIEVECKCTREIDRRSKTVEKVQRLRRIVADKRMKLPDAKTDPWRSQAARILRPALLGHNRLPTLRSTTAVIETGRSRILPVQDRPEPVQTLGIAKLRN